MSGKDSGGIQALIFFSALVLIYLAFFGFDLQKAYQFTFQGNLDIFRDIFK